MKETKKTMDKFYPAEIVLQGDRYFPEEYFNSNCIKRDIFNSEKVDLEDLHILHTHAEGREFLGSYTTEGKLVKYNEFKNWEKTICFSPDYDDDVILVGENWVEIAENPVVYFLLEEKVNEF